MYIVHTSTHACVANVPIFIALNLCSFSHCCCIVIAIHSYAQYQLTEFYSIVFSPSSIHSFVLFCRLFISDCFLIRAFRTKWRNKSTKVHEEHTRTAKEKTDWFPKTFHSMQFTTMNPISINKSTILCLMIVCALSMAHVQAASINSTTDLAEDRSFKSEPVGKHHSHSTSQSHSQSY